MTAKLAEITAMQLGLQAPLDIVPTYAPPNSDIAKSLMTDFDLGSSIPSGMYPVQHNYVYISLVSFDQSLCGNKPIMTRPHFKAVVLPVPGLPKPIGTGQNPNFS